MIHIFEQLSNHAKLLNKEKEQVHDYYDKYLNCS